MSIFIPDDPTNDFWEEVHLGRRFPLCCSNVMLLYDSSTGGWCLSHNFALQKIANLVRFELYSGRFHSPEWTNYPKNATTTTKEHGNYINSQGQGRVRIPHQAKCRRRCALMITSLISNFPFCSHTAMDLFSSGDGFRHSDSDSENRVN